MMTAVNTYELDETNYSVCIRNTMYNSLESHNRFADSGTKVALKICARLTTTARNCAGMETVYGLDLRAHSGRSASALS